MDLYTSFSPLTVIDLSESQPLNAEISILVTLLGIVISVNDEQFENASAPISTTPSGKVMLSRFEQPANALPVILPVPVIITAFRLEGISE